MSWIREVEHDKSEGKTKEVYDRIKEKRGKLSNIMRVQSLMPSAMDHHLDLYLSIMFEDRSLSREQCEMIGVVVSSMNGCDYCVNHHAEALNHYWRDKERTNTLVEGYEDLELPQKDKAMLDFVKKTTEEPDSVKESDLDRLRSKGFSDEQILNMTLIASYFNFVNRIALSMGVELSDEEMKGYEY